MLCCESNLFFGCFSGCAPFIELPINATQTGTHVLQYQFNGYIKSAEFQATSGTKFFIPNIFNELGIADFKILQPDGTYFEYTGTYDECQGEFVDVSDFSVKTEPDLDEVVSSPGTLCSGFKTVTQTEWGNPAGEMVAVLNTQFSTLTNGANLVIGCLANTITFDNGADVITYLPDTGNGIIAIGTAYINPTITISDLAGELLTLQLNLFADQNISDFSTATTPLGDQLSLIFNSYFNLSVNQILSDANLGLGGCAALDLVELYDTLVLINGNYVNGGDNGNLFCPFDS